MFSSPTKPLCGKGANLLPLQTTTAIINGDLLPLLSTFLLETIKSMSKYGHIRGLHTNYTTSVFCEPNKEANYLEL